MTERRRGITESACHPMSVLAAAAGAAAQEAAQRAATAAAAHKAAVTAMPLWQHGLRCTMGVAACLGASVLISRALHKQADKVQAGEVQLQPAPRLSTHLTITSGAQPHDAAGQT